MFSTYRSGIQVCNWSFQIDFFDGTTCVSISQDLLNIIKSELVVQCICNIISVSTLGVELSGSAALYGFNDNNIFFISFSVMTMCAAV